jgi:hypothetical protein
MSYCYGHEVSKKALYVSQNEGNGLLGHVKVSLLQPVN